VAYLRERHINSVTTVALSLSTLAFLAISVSCYGLFGRSELKPDVLRNFTVSALEPLVWTQVAQAGEALCGWCCIPCISVEFGGSWRGCRW
jgi:hypothetical protein